MIAYLKRENKPDLAYQKSDNDESSANSPTIMFLGGFRSDMEGTKAQFLEEKSKELGLAYIRFDYSGHGVSQGDFKDGYISEWADDALAVLDELTEGPVMLIGSSMGGWISLLLALKRPMRIHSIIGLAAAPDFTKIMESKMSEAQRQEMEKNGYFELGNDYSDDPYIITKKLIDDGCEQCLLNGEIDITAPVRLIQGKKDADVDWRTAEKIKAILKGDDVGVILLDEADHRLSSPDELEVLYETAKGLL
jgi:pimeloyl-ACP methyl ester carboxylesterase